MFYNCNMLSNIPELLWNIENVKDISYILYGCTNLKKLPDSSKWNTNNVENMSFMFYNCKKLEKLPDISKWSNQ